MNTDGKPCDIAKQANMEVEEAGADGCISPLEVMRWSENKKDKKAKEKATTDGKSSRWHEGKYRWWLDKWVSANETVTANVTIQRDTLPPQHSVGGATSSTEVVAG